MIVAREREIRNFVKTKYYKINVAFKGFTAEWKVNENQVYLNLQNYIMKQVLKKKKMQRT